MTQNSVLVVYDVPQKARIVPSSFFRTMGVRINLSCWIVPEHKVPLVLNYCKSTLTPAGATWEIVRFDEREAARIHRLAVQALDREFGRIRKSLDESIDKAAQRLSGLYNEKSDAFVRNLLARARRLCKQAAQSATAFGILSDVQLAHDSAREAIGAETDAWLARRLTMRGEQVEDRPLIGASE